MGMQPVAGVTEHVDETAFVQAGTSASWLRKMDWRNLFKHWSFPKLKWSWPKWLKSTSFGKARTTSRISSPSSWGQRSQPKPPSAQDIKLNKMVEHANKMADDAMKLCVSLTSD